MSESNQPTINNNSTNNSKTNNNNTDNSRNNVNSSFSECDVITETIGNFGRWQLRTVILIFLCKIPSVWFMACIIFAAPSPKIHDLYCIQTNNSNNITILTPTTTTPFRTLNHFKSSSIIKKYDHHNHSQKATSTRNTDREFEVNFCDAYENGFINNNSMLKTMNHNDIYELNIDIISCDHFEHKTDFDSLVTDFNLICSRQLLISVSQCFHALGTLLGGLISIVLMNYISPRTLMLCGMIFQLFCGNLTGFMKTIEFFLAFRCISSICCAVMFSAGQAIFSDITGGKPKTIATTLSELFWSIGLIILPGITIFVDSWTYLYVAISCPTIILVFLHRWISESPRWLLKHGKIDKALQVLLESTAFNGKNIPLDIEDRLKTYAEYQKQLLKLPNYRSIWEEKSNRKYIIIVHWAWVWSVMLYNAMILNIRAFGVDHVYVNTVILGFAEMLGVFIGLYFIIYTRKRWLWSGIFIGLAGILTLFIWLVPNTIKESRRVGLDMIFCIGLKMANASSLAILVTCTAEMVSLQKRAMLMLSVTTWSRIWLLIAPFIISTAIFHPLIPITVFAVLAVVTGICMCFLSRRFYNLNQPRIERVPTLNTFRRNSALLLLKRHSTCSQLTTVTDVPLKASISDIWTVQANRDNAARNSI